MNKLIFKYVFKNIQISLIVKLIKFYFGPNIHPAQVPFGFSRGKSSVILAVS